MVGQEAARTGLQASGHAACVGAVGRNDLTVMVEISEEAFVAP